MEQDTCIKAVNDCQSRYNHLQESSMFCEGYDYTTSTFDIIVKDMNLERRLDHYAS